MTRTRLPEHIDLRDFFKHLAEELQHFSSTAYGIESKVGELISDGIRGGDTLRTTLQGLDHLAQTANYLAVFIDSLSRSTDEGATIHVGRHIELVGLRSLAESLVGHAPRQSSPQQGTGDVDLF
jgi:hypothetical protein